jgi:hypothetical protein
MYDGMNPDGFDWCPAQQFVAAVPAAPAVRLLAAEHDDVFERSDGFESDYWQPNSIEWAEE